MEPIFVFFLVLLPVVALVMLLLTWGAYAGKTTLLWSHGGGVMAGGKYWFVLSPALMAADVLVVLVMVILRVNPETEDRFDSWGLVGALVAFLLLALVASYWLPERLKPEWIREAEAAEAESAATRRQARRRG
ncbi:hypothetical protein E7744_12990 [Citricoccus sp. SGAir0253]|uniref:hypothetical protein n=1 Tax=Citricoccus sp. SGAir0253 TaxID=2567881 RepID=UPI0010CCD8BB|nr:hypothetical protein [Citricoccus sp. SGAir0253]QCU78941.1 hypothetical protein E7744_12990 [Citricoccus sp. SGAir0253]